MSTHCPALRVLDLSSCSDVGDRGVVWLCNGTNNRRSSLCQHLISLDVNETSVAIRGIQTALTSLQVLQQLACTDVGEAIGLLALQSEKQPSFKARVADVCLRCEYLSGLTRQSILSAVHDSCSEVTELRVCGELCSSSLRYLSHFDNLTSLQLTGSESLAYNTGFNQLLCSAGCRLLSLVLNDMSGVDVEHVAKCCPLLRHFVYFVSEKSTMNDVISNDEQTDLRVFTELRYVRLHLADIASFPAKYVQLLLKHSTQLECLYLTNINTLTDDLFSGILRVNSLSLISVVELVRCNFISGSAIQPLLVMPNNLCRLFMIDCSLVTLRQFEYFKKIVKQNNYNVELSWC